MHECYGGAASAHAHTKLVTPYRGHTKIASGHAAPSNAAAMEALKQNMSCKCLNPIHKTLIIIVFSREFLGFGGSQNKDCSIFGSAVGVQPFLMTVDSSRKSSKCPPNPGVQPQGSNPETLDVLHVTLNFAKPVEAHHECLSLGTVKRMQSQKWSI